MALIYWDTYQSVQALLLQWAGCEFLGHMESQIAYCCTDCQAALEDPFLGSTRKADKSHCQEGTFLALAGAPLWAYLGRRTLLQ